MRNKGKVFFRTFKYSDHYIIVILCYFQTLMNAAAFKARTIQRNRVRDKRSAALAI